MANYPKMDYKTLRSRLIAMFSEFDDPRQLYNAKKEKDVALYQLEETQKKRDEIDADIDKFNVELIEFKEFVNENLFKIEEHLETIDKCKNIIKNEKSKQDNYSKQITEIDRDIKELTEIAELANVRIESYRPYEEFIAKVIEMNPQYENVFDIIRHVEEMACIRKLGSKLKISMPNDDDNDNNYYNNYLDEIKRDKYKLRVDFNDLRTHLGKLKQSDLAFIRSRTKVMSELDENDDLDLNCIDSIHLKTDLDLMKERRRNLGMEIPKQQIKDKENERQLVIGSIMHQYRELYFRNNGELPTELPVAEDQLTYIFEFYKKTMKRLEIYKNLESGKITIKDYISNAK